MRALHATAVVACWAAGCDTRATASDPGRTDQKSREYESCAASAQCQDELRCFDHTCRRMARSTVGDYYAAAGAYARGRGDLEAAVASYAQAVAHYDADKLGVPPDVDCAYGAALTAARANKDHAELAARVLHRCVLAVPAGSRLREQALGELAQLAEVGLDPVLLGASKLADRYLTRAPQRPATDKLTISVAPTPVPAGKSFPQIPDKLSSAELRPALVACWDAYSAATHRDALTVMIGVKSVVTPSEYEDEPGTVAIKLDPPASAAGPEAAAEACVRQVVEPAIRGLRITDAFTTKLAISIK
jgi:hypothetical protein